MLKGVLGKIVEEVILGVIVIIGEKILLRCVVCVKKIDV